MSGYADTGHSSSFESPFSYVRLAVGPERRLRKRKGRSGLTFKPVGALDVLADFNPSKLMIADLPAEALQRPEIEGSALGAAEAWRLANSADNPTQKE